MGVFNLNAVYDGKYPLIATQGLILHLDVGNSASYPGSGTTWTDLSNNSPAVTLQSGVTFNTGGFLTFDGTANGYADFTATGVSTTTTVEMLVKLKSFTSVMPFGWNSYDVFTSGGSMGYNTAAADVYGISSATVTSLGLLNNWKHYVFEMRSDVSYTNNKIYVNTVAQTLSQVTGTENAANRGFNAGAGRLAGWRLDNNYRMPMDLAIFRVYNRALSQEEITKNFNAFRGRFGL